MGALGKEIIQKKFKNSLPRAGRWTLGKDGVRCSPWPNGNFFCRRLASALGKDPFADGKFPESSLLRAVLGKVFTEGYITFAEGLRPSAKILSAVVTVLEIRQITRAKKRNRNGPALKVKQNKHQQLK